MASHLRLGSLAQRMAEITHHVKSVKEVLKLVDRNIATMEKAITCAGENGCDTLAFHEDSLGLLRWTCGNWKRLGDVLPLATAKMFERIGNAAASRKIYVVLCCDFMVKNKVYNTAFLLGRDGHEIGRYYKVNLAQGEELRARGSEFPVFATPDMGKVGMLICYDMVMPEAIRCLALQGARIVFHSTLGGAAHGDNESSLCAFKTRAVDNCVHLVVSWGSGSMVISPRGEILASGNNAKGPVVFADIDPFAPIDAFGDRRSMIFHQRQPQAYGMLTALHPPVLNDLPLPLSREETARIGMGALTIGEDQFYEAEKMAVQGASKKAMQLFGKLQRTYPGTWIEHESGLRIGKILKTAAKAGKAAKGSASNSDV